jgi:nitrate/TMAO reductase-like tetraheme cytochrome c subunit
MPLRVPAAVRNPVSFVGVAIATAMALVFLALVILDALGFLTNPYIGLVVFVAVPTVFAAGLLLIPLGAWRASRRTRRTGELPEWPVIDLRRPQQRRVVLGVLALTMVNLVIVSMAAYGGVHYMETSAFCGQVCHTTMEPQFVAHQVWPHARVECAQCHIGPGAEAAVSAKAAGTRQLFHVLTGSVPRPVPSPEALIQPAERTCGQCHSGGTSERDVIRLLREYGEDEESSEVATTLRMRVGGPSGGIHRHIDLAIEYPAAERNAETISYVRARYPDGTVREFRTEGAAGAAGEGRLRRMDCLDCHNRAAHTFSPTPGRAVDRAIAAKRIPRGLPFIRRESVAAVSEEYADRAAAVETIATRLRTFYEAQEVDGTLVQRAIAGAQEAWVNNVFPAMKVTWGTYRNDIGHVYSPGCFRCHDESHTAAGGAVISQDCDLCHLIE